MNLGDILNKENQLDNTVPFHSTNKLSPLKLNSPKKSHLNVLSKRKNSPLKNKTPQRRATPQKNLTPLSPLTQSTKASSPLSPRSISRTPDSNSKKATTPKRSLHATSPFHKASTNSKLGSDIRFSIDLFEKKESCRNPLLEDDYEIVYDAYGFRKDSELKDKEFFTSVESNSEAYDFWNQWLSSKDGNNSEENQLDLNLLHIICSKGIPHELRPKIWPSLLDIRKFKEQVGKKYSEIRNLGKHPIYNNQIVLDLNRTYSNHIEFGSSEGRGQRALSNILNAYAHINEKIGYCQGMSFVAGINLMMMNEESSFWCLYSVLKKCDIESYFEPSMIGLIEDTEKLSNLLSIMNPDLYNHLNNLNVEFTIFASRWFLQLFTDLNNWSTILRIWDIILFEGKDGIFRVSLGLLNEIADDLLSIKNTEEVFSYILNIPSSKIESNHFIPKLIDIDIESLMSQYKNLLRYKKISKSIRSRQSNSPNFVSKLWSRIATPSKTSDKKKSVTPFRKNKRMSPIGRAALNSITPLKSPTREFDEELALKSLITFTPSKDQLFLTPLKENQQLHSSTKKRRVLSPVELLPLKKL